MPPTKNLSEIGTGWFASQSRMSPRVSFPRATMPRQTGW
jgi:hypothetical protein